eukprot:5415570-Prymnesium_polylepis.1
MLRRGPLSACNTSSLLSAFLAFVKRRRPPPRDPASAGPDTGGHATACAVSAVRQSQHGPSKNL